MVFGNQFGGFVVVLLRVPGMSVRENRMMRGFFVLTMFKVLGRLLMVLGGFLVMFGGGGVKFGGFFGVRH
ncbi:hypothetical protein [Rhodoblastus sp.]|uniref:hypothetical protein n=1 Tax=Rhodoblastus sp. TaxID=1962975 RepID=UPI003F9660CC